MSYRFNILFMFFGLFPVNAFGVDDIKAEIHDIVKKYHRRSFFHGNVMVKQGDEIVYQNSFGLANDSFDIPHTMQSRFMIASVSKQFTAALILILAQEGLIDIYQPYSHYVDFSKEKMIPENREKWDQFTIYQLLTHTAGLYKDVRRTDFYNPAVFEPFISSILGAQLSAHDIFVSSGEGVRYSNFGYMLLAYLAEKVTGKLYEFLLREKIFIPLGMKSSGEYHRMKNIKLMAEGHLYPGGFGFGKLKRRCCHDATSFKGGYSLYSDAKDLMIWLDNLSSEEPKVLTKESIAMMTRAHFEVELYEKGVSYGFGLYINQFNGSQRYWHDGFEYGYVSLVSVTPEKDLKIVILGNRHGGIDDFSYGYTREMNDEISQLFPGT